MHQRSLGVAIERSYWARGTAERVATGLTGLITVLVALKAAAYTPTDFEGAAHLQNQMMRLIAFAALTIWATFTMGISRRGVAAMMVMVFALFLETVVLPARGASLSTLAGGAVGIGLAYLGFQFYSHRVYGRTERAVYDRSRARP